MYVFSSDGGEKNRTRRSDSKGLSLAPDCRGRIAPLGTKDTIPMVSFTPVLSTVCHDCKSKKVLVLGTLDELFDITDIEIFSYQCAFNDIWNKVREHLIRLFSHNSSASGRETD